MIKAFFQNLSPAKLYTLIVSVCVCVVALLAVIISESINNAKPKQAAAPAQLVALEKQDTKEIEKTIHNMKVEALIKKAEASLDKELEDGKSSIWSLFENYAVLGDSRAVGFSYYNFLRDDRVFAAGGNTIRDIPALIKDLKAISPATIYLCYGLNDTGIGHWKNGKEYGKELRQVFDKLKKALPDTQIVASSILPATEAALEKSPVWRKIPDFDKALKEACREKGVIYVDNSELVEKYMSTLYDEDGVHLRPAFYPKWAKNLYMAPILAEIEQ